jgi:hypothetical protein
MSTITEQNSTPNLFSITQDQIVTNEGSSKIITKKSKCGLNFKSLLQFILMIMQLIFQIIILYKEYNK